MDRATCNHSVAQNKRMARMIALNFIKMVSK
jgi:hypothetical protein